MILYFVTSNSNKVEEARRALSEYGVYLEQRVGGKLEVQADDVSDVSRRAAEELCKVGENHVVVEDDGLYIKALNGFPGPYSEYVYRTLGLSGVLKLLEGVEDRAAYFKSAVSLCLDGWVYTFSGVAEGRISEGPKGSAGFGFDPIFVPDGFAATFAELGAEVKARVSHRARAFRALGEWIRNIKNRG